MANDYTVDELNEQLKRTNELLKDAEKRFEGLLKIVTNMNKTATKSTGTYGSSSTDKVFKQAEKKTHEFNKQMDKMLEVRQQLIDQEYDRLDKNRREGQEQTRQFILMRRETKMMEESGKTKRKEMSLQAKRIDMMGRLAGGAQGGLAGFIGMGLGTALARGSEASGTAGDKVSGIQERIMNYQNQAGMMEKTAIGTPTGKIQSKMLSRLEKISPRLAKFTYGKEGDDGTRKGGALGKAAGGIGAAGGMIGLAGGAAGGLLGGAIMKGLESSPMFQAISKIMSTAFNLILRPIGDFFSAVFKPISIVLMKWGAVNLRKWAESMQNGTNEAMKMADMMGKSIIAFFEDPLAFFNKSIEHLGKVIWTGSSDILDKYVQKNYEDLNARLDRELAITNGAFAEGASVVSGIKDAVERVNPANTLGGADIQGGDTVNDELILLGENLKETNEDFTDKQDQVIDNSTNMAKQSDKALKDQKIKLTNASQNAMGIAIAFEESYKEIGRRLQALIKTQIKVRTTVDEDGSVTLGKPDADLVRTQDLMNQAAKKINYGGQLGKYYQNQALNKIKEEASRSAQTEAIVHKLAGGKNTLGFEKQANKINKLVQDGVFGKEEGRRMIQKLYTDMIQGAGKITVSAEGQARLYAARQHALTGMANGGVISEPVFGVGRSGRSYLLGENGAEKVSPMSGSSNDSVVVNINIAKMSSDVDLNQIKPIIERALLETHARRGII